MSQSLAVTISGVKGTSHFKLTNKAVLRLKVIFSVMLFVIGLISTGVFYLLDELKLTKEQQALLQLESIDLSEQLQKYQQLKEELEGDISVKENKLKSVTNRLQDIETFLGGNNENLDVESRLDIAAINTAVRLAILTQIPNGSPVKDARISSPFGMRVHPVTKKKTMHRGLDYAVNTGTPIYAPADSVVQIVRKSNQGSGNFLRLSHAFGITSSYSHLKSFKVHTGQFIKKGELVAYSGNSGLTSGPHLHYEIRFVGRALDPRPFVDWNIDNFESIFKNQKGIQWDSLVKNVERQVSTALQLSSLREPASQVN
ncbi:peptidase M23 [Vibrio sp. HA2012]|uniref:M23 family metallopeptidase n=1 Tax=Vibrio sp. HA2012 TaxID=1971595 RepID=UPI000C2C9E91|nr:M23 family metallopeptidase [Vibrio sp. HA2012]PJC87982.1 peptidase M23 [Vibrio sp. HA2012]